MLPTWTPDGRSSIRAGPEAAWRSAVAATSRRIAVPGDRPAPTLSDDLTDLIPGSVFAYRVRKDGEIVFAARTLAHPRRLASPIGSSSFGDCGAGTLQQKLIAVSNLSRPARFHVITGDIVYSRGRISEYRAKFWPIYNADNASPLAGAPLLRSTLFVAAPGNHDIATRDLEKYPDGLAYFLYWDQPATVRSARRAGLCSHCSPGQPPTRRRSWRPPAKPTRGWRISRSTTVMLTGRFVDSNPYVDWANPQLRAWVERDLAAAAKPDLAVRRLPSPWIQFVEGTLR